MPNALVVRARSRAWKQIPAERKVYVARPSKFGNPFIIGRDGDRGQCIEKFRVYFDNNPALQALARKRLTGMLLGCYCYPEPCHAEILAEFVNRPPGHLFPVIPIKVHKLSEHPLCVVKEKLIWGRRKGSRQSASWSFKLDCGHTEMRPARVARDIRDVVDMDVKPANFWRRAPRRVRCRTCPLRS